MYYVTNTLMQILLKLMLGLFPIKLSKFELVSVKIIHLINKYNKFIFI